MSNTMTPTRIDNEGFEERWAAWEARGAEHDRATRRKLFILAAVLILSGAVLSGMLSAF